MTKLVIDSLTPLTNAPAKERGYPDKYLPTDKEDYMNAKQLAYFRDLLLVWRQELLEGNNEAIQGLQEHSAIEADMTDQATIEYEQTLELRNRDRARKLISKIDSALRRIDDGEYGYCEVTGEPISLGRLEARPIATMTVEAQERHERQEKVSRDD